MVAKTSTSYTALACLAVFQRRLLCLGINKISDDMSQSCLQIRELPLLCCLPEDVPEGWRDLEGMLGGGLLPV